MAPSSRILGYTHIQLGLAGHHHAHPRRADRGQVGCRWRRRRRWPRGGHQGGGRHLGQIAWDGSTDAGQHFRRLFWFSVLKLWFIRISIELSSVSFCFVSLVSLVLSCMALEEISFFVCCFLLFLRVSNTFYLFLVNILFVFDCGLALKMI